MTSLAELRAIEEERVAAERAAIAMAAEAKRRAAEEAEARRIAEEQARIIAEREAALAIERAREAAEREARLRVEAAEAAERARLTAALEQERLAGELELRRAEVARKRPTWMVGVTIGAFVAACGLAWFAIDQMRVSEAALASQAAAVDAGEQAKADALSAARSLEDAQRELVALGDKIDAAFVRLEAARTADERKRAEDELKRLRLEQRAAEDRRQQAIRDKAAKDRAGGLHINKDCLHAALGKNGC